MIGVAVGTMALVIVLSVFNGLEDLIKGLYASFDAELKVEAAQGKSFEVDEEWLAGIHQLVRCESVCYQKGKYSESQIKND